MKDFLSFRKLITPILIQILFWVSIAFFLYVGVKDLLNHHVLSALQVIIVGPLLARIISEVLILAFRINSNLSEINSKLTK